MRKVCTIFILLGCLAGRLAIAQSEVDDATPRNNLLYAVAWKQTAAEYRALYYQGFAVARLRVENAVANRKEVDRPLAVIADVDDTLLLSNAYWGYLVNQGRDFFDDAAWDDWIRGNRTIASPGALEFLAYCLDNNVEVFYVTSRDQGEDTFNLALGNLTRAGFPYVDARHLTVLRETSNKETVQSRIGEEYQVVVMLGDNLNDFSRRYYVTDIDERKELADEDRALYGMQFVLFPNPTDGHWIRAIFGESEPAATEQNRRTLHDAATRDAWEPLIP